MIVLVDFSNVAWACYYAWFNSTSSLGSSAEDGSLYNLKLKAFAMADVFRVPLQKFIWTEDRTPKEKLALFPDYKGGRKVPEFDPRPSMKVWLKSQGCTFVHSKDNEADDVIATLVCLPNKPAKFVVVTGDKDLWQLLSRPSVTVWDPIRKEFIGKSRILKAFGTSEPKDITLIKILWGDPSDNIPNAAPRMQKQLMPLIKSGKTLKDILGAGEVSQRCKFLLIQNERQITTNHQLVTLKQNCELTWE